MKSYMVSYDLNFIGQNYTDLIKAIENYQNAISILRSVWLIQSPDSAQEICDHLLQFMDANDEIVVAEITTNTSLYLEKSKISALKRF